MKPIAALIAALALAGCQTSGGYTQPAYQPAPYYPPQLSTYLNASEFQNQNRFEAAAPPVPLTPYTAPRTCTSYVGGQLVTEGCW